jgi:hypothetical protein
MCFHINLVQFLLGKDVQQLQHLFGAHPSSWPGRSHPVAVMPFQDKTAMQIFSVRDDEDAHPFFVSLAYIPTKDSMLLSCGSGLCNAQQRIKHDLSAKVSLLLTTRPPY